MATKDRMDGNQTLHTVEGSNTPALCGEPVAARIGTGEIDGRSSEQLAMSQSSVAWVEP